MIAATVNNCSWSLAGDKGNGRLADDDYVGTLV